MSPSPEPEPVVAGGVAWQRELRDRYAAEGAPCGVDLSLKRARVERVSRSAAERIILRYEWLGTMNPGAGLYFGISFGDYLGGVTCVSIGSGTAGSHAHRQYGVESGELATLARGACVHWAPPGANSKLVAWTVRLLRETAARLVVAYADPEAGEIGTIYQACGWTYVGPTPISGNRMMVSPQGRVVNHSRLGALARERRLSLRSLMALLEQRGWEHRRPHAKRRYVAQVDRDPDLRARLDAMALPYPKRAKHSVDAPAAQAGEGGSTPTRALQGTA